MYSSMYLLCCCDFGPLAKCDYRGTKRMVSPLVPQVPDIVSPSVGYVLTDFLSTFSHSQMDVYVDCHVQCSDRQANLC